jgi:selenide,water dikinase
MNEIKLTSYSHGAGCGCKISPQILSEILHTEELENFPNLLVGYNHRDDAAVFDQGDGTAIISTTDFFMPIVDDPFTFGQIASVNAISDVYAMGGMPMMAIGILGWPVDKLDSSIASLVLKGARNICALAGIPLAGGHSIDSPEPIFGLAVTGKVNIANLKTNAGAKEGDLIYLTKPLGVGILTTAEKKGILKKEDQLLAIESMLRLNSIGGFLSKFDYIHSITDVTGFGLAGHLIEMAEASNCHAVINYVNLPLINESILNYIEAKAIPGGTKRNWDSYGYKVSCTDSQQIIIADPQTSGGLLIAVDPNNVIEFENVCREKDTKLYFIGKFDKKVDTKVLTVI